MKKLWNKPESEMTNLEKALIGAFWGLLIGAGWWAGDILGAWLRG